MRAVIVVYFDKLIEPLLLLQEVIAGRLGGLLFESQMHALVAPILLWVSWLNAFDTDAEA